MSTQMNNFLLIGEPGVGKTTIIQSILGEFNLVTGGFISLDIRSGKTQKGVQLITLDAQQAVMASINKKSSYKVGKFGVDIKVIDDLGVAALQKAIKSADLIVIDEIGKMTCCSKAFRDMVIRCFNSPKPVLGALQNFASPFINDINNREDIVRINTTTDNRDELSGNILQLLKQITAASKPSKSSKAKGKRKRR